MKEGDLTDKEEYSHNIKLVEKVKETIRELLALTERPRENYSVYISKRLDLNYTYLASVFSETSGITIEHFIIQIKIEQAIKMLAMPEYSIKDISEILSYSSMGHFSNQFKKITGVSPTVYRKKLLPSTEVDPEQ